MPTTLAVHTLGTMGLREQNPMPALQDALAGRYTLHGELGRGGMGIVYLAREVALERLVALKLLPPQATGTHWRDRFVREARIAAQLTHPNIVPIYAVEQAGDFVFFTMAFVDGETLGDRIRAHGALPAGEVTRLLDQVARAVSYAHGRGVIHRDLKPDNVLIETASGRPMILDFGIAQLGADRDVGTGTVQGTLAFVSPERAIGRAADARSDIYALGVTAHYAASGQVPFRPASAEDIVQVHARRAVPPLEARGQDGDATLARVVARCLAEKPEERFQSAEELVRALAEAPEIRGDVPIPMRAFSGRAQALARSAAGLSVISAGSVLAFLGDLTLVGAGLALLAGGPVGAMLVAARRVLKAGYDQETVVRTLGADLDRQGEVAAFELGAMAHRGRVARRIAYGALGVMAAAAAWLATGRYGANAALVAFGLSVPTAMIAGLLSHIRARAARRAIVARRVLRFLDSPAGTWALRLAGVGLKPSGGGTAKVSASPHAPEMLDLMDTQIRRIKAWLDAPDTLDGQRDSSEWATGNLAALESMRARLATGASGGPTPGALTADLAAARRVCEMVELMFGARMAAEDMEEAR